MSLPTQIKFSDHDCTLMLVLPELLIPEHIKSAGETHGLLLKPELHVSIVVSENARRVRDLVDEFQQYTETLQNLETLARAQDWTFERLGQYSLHEEMYTREKLLASGKSDVPAHVRRSIIERVELPGMKTYYEGLAALLGPSFPVPLAHITFFSWSDFAPLAYRGISILSDEDYARTLMREL